MNSLFKIIFIKNNIEIEVSAAINKNIKYSKNIAALFMCDLYPDGNIFNEISKYDSYIRIENTLLNEVIFNGRVISVNKDMDSNGYFKASIIAESYLNYLNDVTFMANINNFIFHPTDIKEIVSSDTDASTDSKKKNIDYYNQTVETFLKYLLDYYNSRIIDPTKKIKLGNIEVTDLVYIQLTKSTSILSLIQEKIIARHDGYLILRSKNNTLYLDFLKSNPETKITPIELGLNQSSISIDDNFNFYTRIIPIGKDGIDISSVNSGLNYIEDNNLIKQYGIIEKIMEWPDVTIPQNLFNKANLEYKKLCLGLDNIKLTALDLSYLNNDIASLKLYRKIKASNSVLNYDKVHEIVNINLNLDSPYLSTFDLNIEEVSANNNVNSVIEQVASNKIEIVSMGNEILTKVSNDMFESYKEQSANEIKNTVKTIDGKIQSVIDQTDNQITQTVKDFNNGIESIKTQTANEIADKVSSETFQSTIKQTNNTIIQSVSNVKEELNSEIKTTADSIQASVNNNQNNTSALIKELTNEISTKISSKEAMSEFIQKLNEFDFILGKNTALSIFATGLNFNFGNGTQINLNEDGFYYINEGKHFSYHSLFVHDSITRVASGTIQTIQVPPIFQGKEWYLEYFCGNTFPANPDDRLQQANVELVEKGDDYFKIKLEIAYIRPGESQGSYRGWGNIVYTILA